jgi:hypothetical protein
MRFDQSQLMTAAVILPAAAYNADNTPATVDLGPAQSATVLIEVGVGGITFTGVNKVEFVLTHSDEAAANFTAVAQADVVGPTGVTAGIVRSLVAAHGTPSVTRVGYVGRKRYLRLLADFSGTHGAATPLSAVVVIENLDRIAPA